MVEDFWQGGIYKGNYPEIPAKINLPCAIKPKLTATIFWMEFSGRLIEKISKLNPFQAFLGREFLL